MGFLSPLLLLAAAALAVPLMLHLFRRRERSRRSFPALRYLKETSRDRARYVRLRQLLLLALRLAVLACLVLAAARLVLPLGGTDHPPGGLAVVVDNGVTSSRVVDDRRVLD
ncbi:MAG: BatA domain-containing protein, partial [Gemmatimonadota bacterium]